MTHQTPRRGASAPGGRPQAPTEVVALAGSGGIHPTTRALATFLDDLVRVPGTKWSFGGDAVLGLVPGVGDAATSALSAVILADAVRLGVPLPILGRMVGNLVLDAAVGQVPLVGDLGDLAFRSNRRNLALLERAVADPEHTGRRSLAYLVGAGALGVTAVVVMVVGTLFGLWWLAKLLGIF